MYEYSKKKIIKERPYRQMQYKYDLLYKRLINSENNNKFWEKYCILNEKLKEEEQY